MNTRYLVGSATDTGQFFLLEKFSLFFINTKVNTSKQLLTTFSPQNLQSINNCTLIITCFSHNVKQAI